MILYLYLYSYLQVNKAWNRLVTGCTSLWSRLIWEAGVRQPLKIIHNHVDMLAKRIHYNKQMINRKAIKEFTIKAANMAANVNVNLVYLKGNMLAIGKI